MGEPKQPDHGQSRRREYRVITRWNSGGEDVTEGLDHTEAHDRADSVRERNHEAKIEYREVSPWVPERVHQAERSRLDPLNYPGARYG